MIRNQYPFKFSREIGNCLVFNLEEIGVEVRVFVLEERMIRVLFIEDQALKLNKTWSIAPGEEDIPFEGKDRFDVSGFSLPDYEYEQFSNKFEIRTSALKAVIELDGFKIQWYAKKENRWVQIASDRQTQSYNFANSLGEGVCHYLTRDESDQYFGLGEKAGNVNKHGRRYRMFNVDPMGYDAETTDPLYKHIPFYITRRKADGISYGLFYDNMASSEFELGSELDNYHQFYRYYKAENGDLDYYMILGPDIKNTVETFSWLTGKTIFQPKWSLGYSGSTMTYTDAPDAQEQLKKFLESCRVHDIPCDSFQLSSGYTSIGDKRYVFNWNRTKFPEPKKLAGKFDEAGVKLCANIKPCLLTDHPQFNELDQQGLFVRSRDNSESEIAQFWDDLGAYIDFTNPKAIKWWKDNVKQQLLEYGIESTWNDNNEYEIWDSKARTNGFGESIDIGLIRPVQPLLMAKASYEAQQEYEPSKRPYLISRSGSPGMQRYVQTWTGDNRTSWKSLKYNIRMGIGLSLSGIYNFGHDVGGFAGDAPEPELFVRWVQNGIFHPRFTIHSWNDDGSVNVPWMYPEVAETIRDLIKFRCKITPYLYQLMYEAHSKYQPAIRPTFYEFESDPETFQENNDFMLGSQLLVCSVVEKGTKERTVYLPDHQEGWYDFHTQQWYEGGQEVIIPAPLNYTPLMAKAGAIIPVNDAKITFEDAADDQRGFILFPPKGYGETEYELFEDDGISFGYLQGDYTKVHIKMRTLEDVIEIDLNKAGSYQLPYETIRLHFPAHESRSVVINGKKSLPYSTTDEKVYAVSVSTV